ncbi:MULTISPECIES: DUF2269 domain-containing protein [unclassified Brevundimonas]|uniref:DUF2269 family protein n=1 Tax=unclassified Brevundimonas TaxID=2622653 RepID=UPI000CFCA71B|nr:MULTISPECIES: DUF2269 domain-containing protein [unclassified Brevundimonas]PRA24045.1 hypothetical protein CQ024_14735 [Brevundimonas sp. MYb27]PQZ82876.1 hypothetical protein CQ026_07755 [Brevundimonas sp. MYb31]PRB16728.1 hypothetical protein CQ039_03450 [Brevundimonas sp. MYb52]PRB34735.1 hypothetical protein CQ035_10275 [Brevundimonas sp. MYb46]PRB54697.1 hypothetical protein CQ028_03935 [Brevundimonas sp. MYb33]
MTYLILKIVHILSGAVLFGTGAGIAFFMLRAYATKDPRTVAAVGRIVVLADFVFTASAVVIQPISGLALIHLQGYALTEPWLLAAYGLYVLIGVCWLPVVWFQWRMVKLAEGAVAAGTPLPPAYHRLFRAWFILGWPAFAGVIGIYALMVAKPVF